MSDFFFEINYRIKIKEGYEKFVSSTFIHHGPNFKGTWEAFLNAMKENTKENSSKEIDIKYALEDNDIVAVFSHIKQSQMIGMAAAHLFRFDEMQIVEL